jgi:hypothetical protein
MRKAQYEIQMEMKNTRHTSTTSITKVSWSPFWAWYENRLEAEEGLIRAINTFPHNRFRIVRAIPRKIIMSSRRAGRRL